MTLHQYIYGYKLVEIFTFEDDPVVWPPVGVNLFLQLRGGAKSNGEAGLG
jgi:hypothetical protein